MKRTSCFSVAEPWHSSSETKSQHSRPKCCPWGHERKEEDNGAMWVAKSLVTLQAALCSYRHDGSRLRAYLFFQPRSATACQHAQTPLRCAPVSACAGRAACSRRGPDPFRRPLVTYQWSQRSALGRGLRVPPSAGGLARCTAQRKATRSGQVG